MRPTNLASGSSLKSPSGARWFATRTSGRISRDAGDAMHITPKILRSGTIVATIVLWEHLSGWPHTSVAQPAALGPNKWPTTVEDTVRDLLAHISAADKAY